MLIRFSIENYRSIQEQQELSLVASKLSGPEDGLIEAASIAPEKLLPVAIIYGANASGKTTIFAGLRYLIFSVKNSHAERDPVGGTQRKTFGLDPECKNKKSSFEIEFILNGIRFRYGFECNDQEYTGEWLYSYKSKKAMLFERYGSNGKDIVFGRSLRGQNRLIGSIVRDNSLFLSAAAQNSHEQLTEIYSYIVNIAVSLNINSDKEYIQAFFRKQDIDKRTIQFLKIIGSGIVEASRDRVKLSKKTVKLRQDILDVIKKNTPGLQDFRNEEEIESPTRIRLGHSSIDKNIVYLDLDSESAGTRRLLIILAGVFSALDQGGILLIDEFDASLHTQICESIIGLFLSRKTNTHGAQLIITTHDTNLLLSPKLRRDQVWFVEKNSHGATYLYPLSDIATRATDNIEKGYLQGRFGAIPFSGAITHFFGEKNG